MRRAMGALALLVAMALLSAACGGGSNPTATTTATVAASPNPPTMSPAAPTPSEPNPTATPRAGAYELAPVLPTAAFELMLGVYPLPGSPDDVIVVTQTGSLWRVSMSGADAILFGDVADRLDNPQNEEGLLGLAFSPQFESDGRIYLDYTTGGPRRSVISRFLVVEGELDPDSEQVLLEVRQPFSNHNGGQLAFGPDGYLYVALGDGGAAGDPEGNGQDVSTLLATILRLDVSGVEYAIPPDNPLVAVSGARSEIYAYGLRNPWRFSFDRATGDLWTGDVGQNEWEEVDRIVSGANYGWNIAEGFECFQTSDCDMSGLSAPRAVYGHDEGCSVTGGFVYRGGSLPELDGWYVYGDFCSGRIWAVNTTDDSPPLLLAETDLPISSFGELPDGELLVVTFANAIFQLVRSDES